MKITKTIALLLALSVLLVLPGCSKDRDLRKEREQLIATIDKTTTEAEDKPDNSVEVDEKASAAEVLPYAKSSDVELYVAAENEKEYVVNAYGQRADGYSIDSDKNIRDKNQVIVVAAKNTERFQYLSYLSFGSQRYDSTLPNHGLNEQGSGSSDEGTNYSTLTVLLSGAPASATNHVVVLESSNSEIVEIRPNSNAKYLAEGAFDENAWCATATVTKSVTDTVNMNAVKLYASPQNHNSTQQLVIYDPEEQPSTVTDSATATIYAYVEMVGYAQLEKTSADTGLTADNPCYSLENAAYGVFSSVEEANWGAYPIATMVTDTAGVSNVVALPVGDYYVKEINAPAGYALDPNVYPITVQQGSTAVLQCSDIPTSDPVLIVLKKVDAAIFDEGRTSGGMSLEGAEYKVDYYPDQFASAEAAFATGLPGRSWTLRTDSQGYAFFDTEHFVEGDPYYYVDEKQLPPAIDIICNALKAGYTFQLAMNTVAKELEDPISEEFLMAFSETQYGVPLSTALKNVAKRTASKDIELLEVAVSVQTNVGGNMIEILQNISRSLREKHDLEADIQAKTASGKLTGILLAVLPIFLLIALSFLNPEYVSLFLNERNGRLMLAFAAGWELLGFLVIRKKLNVKY